MFENDNSKWYAVRTDSNFVGQLRISQLARLLQLVSDQDKIDVPQTPYILINGAALIKGLKAL